MKRPCGLLAALLVAGALAGCGTTGRAAAPGVRRAAAGELTPAFAAMQRILLDGAAPRAAGDTRALRALGPRVAQGGLALLAARMPHDLSRGDVGRFLDGRALFGERLKQWVTAAEGQDDDVLLGAWDALVDAYWGWSDVTQGLPPERAV